jgi:hypothetical protein
MKFEIEVAQIPSMDLDKPSDELREFLRQLHGFLLFLCNNFTFPGHDDLSAYLRWGSSSILNVKDFTLHPMLVYGGVIESYSIDPNGKELRSAEEYELVPYDIDEVVDSPIVMEADVPGNWCVLRLCCPVEIELNGLSSKFATLFSKDFENGTAEEVFRQVVAGSEQHCLRVPKLSPKLQEMIRIIES